MTGTTACIRWEDTASVIDAIASRGFVGKLERRSFIIYKPEFDGGQYRLLCLIGDRDGESLHADDPDELKATAERWLEEFISSLGASFGGPDAIERWQDVRDGDLVLLDDELVTAECVSICQKPWGDGTTFTAADISHRLENGVLVTSERHGDRFTAVRRPVPPHPEEEADR